MTGLLSGRLGFVFIGAIVNAVLFSWVAVLWYRRSVRRLMQSGADELGSAVAANARSAAPNGRGDGLDTRRADLPEVGKDMAPASGLMLVSAQGDAHPRSGVRAGVGAGSAASLRIGLAYAAGAAVHALVMSSATIAADENSWLLPQLFAQVWMNTWPIVPTLIAIGVLGFAASVRVVAAYLALGSSAMMLLTAVRQLAFSALDLAPFSNVFWLLVGTAVTASLPLALLCLTAWRRVRAVIPLALATMLLFGFGLMTSTDVLIAWMQRGDFRAGLLALAAFTSPEVARYAPFLLMSLPIGWLAWQLLGALARGFARKRFSDVQLVIDCWWAIVTAEQIAVNLASPYGGASLWIGLAAFAAYRAAVALVLRGQHRALARPAPRLLLLRVFGHQRRTESLFDAVAQRWRLRGPVQLIGGVDLAMRTLDPGDTLEFIAGRFADQCVIEPEEVPRRLARVDVERDPDGRFRVNEIYCRADTWRSTLCALLEMTDTVLMDLRSFSERNAGCRFELEQLVRHVPSDQVVLICDRTTDQAHLQSLLGDAWADAKERGLARGEAQFVTVSIERQSRRELESLLEVLLRASDRAHVEPAPARLALSA